MPTKLYIFGEGPLWPPRNGLGRERDLTDDLNNWLQDWGEVIYDLEDEHHGPCWNVDLLIFDDADLDGWIRRLVAFLRTWGILDRTLSVTIRRDGSEPSWEHRRIDVATETIVPTDLPERIE